ncbi:hypothetical protein RFI36_08055 [Acinetobacter gerneri]|uniref:Lipoprotein n=1 Tax=Acinetobacter gerneri TaxID=202952 RepID=A0AAW8JFY8_9GAMM|nr:hypothetical protein [Acinetobacter gerneri]MDQ9009739.1 hypothetical protein [Acinetobacter gerneri]MDQ9013711.1 hypothetical protein [Acinetobacter gerneri]MDQ9025125.1 hypothetical protein [Acinetobacter gerneri]MDQ9050888.1 hypothetical protein [Acinetobacter gerneri]MDQ9059760.1 hypothetical protein [Acinetobacter gerneri]
MKTKDQIIALATTLFLLGSTTCYAFSPTNKEVSTQNKTITLNQDTILKTAYPKTQTEAMAYQEPKELDDYFKNLPPIQLEKDVLGFIHPAIQFNNAQGEERYLVIVEKVNIYDGYIQACRACSSTADLLLYKIQNGQFVLINSAKNQDQIPSADGHFTLKLKEQLNKNLQAFGKNMMGSYVKATFSGSGGHEESHWYAVLLPDTGKIQAIEIGYAGGSTSSYFADRPHLASSTSSTLKIIANGADYYPIEVTYTDKGNKKPYKSKFTYNAKKSEYVETKLK